ncbi:MAG: SRPBCC family protein [Alphaproteobacteria bacterium]
MADDRLARLVDTDRGVIDRTIFTAQDLFEQEQETLFTRAWLLIGHEGMVPEPGDYVASRMGTEPVILTRDRDGKLHAFLNSCRHRGMKVCLFDQGNTRVFTCPYHAWSYGTDGKLVGVPMREKLYPDMDLDRWGLIEVAQLAVYKGTVWATWDADAPPFLDFLGGAKLHLDLALDARDGREGGSEALLGIHKWVVPCNWKLPAENFCGDTYHNPSHASVDMIGIGPSAASGQKGRRDGELDGAQHLWVSFPGGHGIHSAMVASNDYTALYADDPEISDYFRHCHEERVRRKGEDARLRPFVGTIFPNASFHGGQPRALCMWHPVDAGHTEVWRFFLVDADAPERVKAMLRKFYMRYSGPAGMTEQDDMENWNYATAGARGPIASRHPFNYQQSIGRHTPDGGGRLATQITEENARNFYRHWRLFLEGRPWDELIAQAPRQAAE